MQNDSLPEAVVDVLTRLHGHGPIDAATIPTDQRAAWDYCIAEGYAVTLRAFALDTDTRDECQTGASVFLADPGAKALARHKLNLSTPERSGGDAGVEELDLVALRQAIAELGRDAKADAVIGRVKIGKSRGRQLLRILESRGEYSGFTGPVPSRYRK